MSINIYDGPLFGLIISIVTFEIGIFLYKKTKMAIFNPLLISILLIVSYLLLVNISYEQFMQGGSYISFFLKPATVILAVPLYKQQKYLKKYFKEIMIGSTLGCSTAIIGVISIAKFLNLSDKMMVSIIPKSITAPIGIELSKSLGGIASITVVTIVLTGIIGSIIAPKTMSLLKIKNPIAKGIAIGTSAHAVGTAKAIEIGEIEGAMSGLAIGLSGLLTVILTPIILYLVN